MSELTVAEFLDYVGKTKSGSTYETYFRLFKSFSYRLGKRLDEITIFDLNRNAVEGYLRGKTPNTKNTFIAALKSYARYVEENIPLDSMERFMLYKEAINRVRSFRRRKIPRIPKREAITVQELGEVLRALSDHDDLFTATVVHFYFGARPSELARPFKRGKIDPGRQEYGNYLDPDSLLISIVSAKTGDLRILPFSEKILRYLERWVELSPLVSGYGGRGNEWYTKKIKRLLGPMGVKITAKTARKTVETELSRMGVPQWEINYWLGHRTGIPDAYRDVTVLIDEVRATIAERHFLLSLL